MVLVPADMIKDSVIEQFSKSHPEWASQGAPNFLAWPSCLIRKQTGFFEGLLWQGESRKALV
jgi:hypothetical protein